MTERENIQEHEYFLGNSKAELLSRYEVNKKKAHTKKPQGKSYWKSRRKKSCKINSLGVRLFYLSLPFCFFFSYERYRRLQVLSIYLSFCLSCLSCRRSYPSRRRSGCSATPRLSPDGPVCWCWLSPPAICHPTHTTVIES